MENMNNYSETFERKGGHFEVIGWMMRNREVHILLRSEKILPKQMSPKEGVLTKRQKYIQKISEEMQYSYDAFSDLKIEELPSFGYFKTRKLDKISNVLTKNDCTIFDVQFSEGEMIAKQVIKATMFHIQTQNKLPKFTLDKEGVFEYLLHFAGYKDIEINAHPDFNKRFYLSGKNEEKI